jgi:hypothetical protein
MNTKREWKKAWRLVREPDRYMACDTDGVYRFKCPVPLGIFKLAEICLEERSKKHGKN